MIKWAENSSKIDRNWFNFYVIQLKKFNNKINFKKIEIWFSWTMEKWAASSASTASSLHFHFVTAIHSTIPPSQKPTNKLDLKIPKIWYKNTKNWILKQQKLDDKMPKIGSQNTKNFIWKTKNWILKHQKLDQNNHQNQNNKRIHRKTPKIWYENPKNWTFIPN